MIAKILYSPLKGSSAGYTKDGNLIFWTITRAKGGKRVATALAKQLNVPLEIIKYPSTNRLLDELKYLPVPDSVKGRVVLKNKIRRFATLSKEYNVLEFLNRVQRTESWLSEIFLRTFNLQGSLYDQLRPFAKPRE